MTILGLYRSFQPKHSDPSGRMDSVLRVLGPSVFLCVHNHMYHSAIIAFTHNCSYSYLATWHLADWSKLHMPWGAPVSSHYLASFWRVRFSVLIAIRRESP